MNGKTGNGRHGPEGSRVRYAGGGRAMVVRTDGGQWSDEAEEVFFDHLAATCNVRASVEAAGFTPPTVYRQRRMRPEFAARWKATLEHAYACLEMALVEAALDSMAGSEIISDRPIPRMSVDQAMQVLRAYRNEVAGNGRRGRGRLPRRPTLDEVRASIEKKVRAIEAARELGQE